MANIIIVTSSVQGEQNLTNSCRGRLLGLLLPPRKSDRRSSAILDINTAAAI